MMENPKCAIKSCRKPPVTGSRYCHYHLSKITRIIAVIGGATVSIALIMATLLKFFLGGRKA